jgi:hypothetical protein
MAKGGKRKVGNWCLIPKCILRDFEYIGESVRLTVEEITLS